MVGSGDDTNDSPHNALGLPIRVRIIDEMLLPKTQPSGYVSRSFAITNRGCWRAELSRHTSTRNAFLLEPSLTRPHVA